MTNQYRNPNHTASSVFGEENGNQSMRAFDNIVLDRESQSDLVANLEGQQYNPNGTSGQSPNFNSFSFNTYNNAYPDALEDMKAMAGLPVASVPLTDNLSPRNPEYANINQGQGQDPSQLLNDYNNKYGAPDNVWQQQNPILNLENDFQYSSYQQQPRPGPSSVVMAKQEPYAQEPRKLQRSSKNFSYSSPVVPQVKKEASSPSLKHESPGDGEDYSKKGGRTRSAHNIIEQRYRNRMNDKFTALQNCVPTLRIAARRGTKTKNDFDADMEQYPGSDSETRGNDDLEGLTPATKLNKATILTKSVEYIKFLEKKNNRMRSEHQQLVERARMLGISLSDDLLNPDMSQDPRNNRG